MVKFNKDELQGLLKAAKRVSYVGGKKKAQVHGCIITQHPDSTVLASIIGTVLDGVTSVHNLSIETKGPPLDPHFPFQPIPVANIDYMLGVLKTHSSPVTLDYWPDTSKVLVKSKGKQTTLISSLLALAYPNSTRLNLQTQQANALGVIKRCGSNGEYTDKKGVTHNAVPMIRIKKDLLLDALQSVHVNGQNKSNLRLHGVLGKTYITSGDTLKGKTSTCICENWECSLDISFGGGLENILPLFPSYMDDLLISVYDIRDLGGGFIMGFHTLTNWRENGFIVLQVGSEYED